MGWEGRQLKSASKDGTSLSFTYDSESIRTSKTVGTVKTSYLLNGTQILAQTTNGKTLCFFYDQQGSRVAMADGSNHIYYYLYNLQGDVIALADAETGKLVVTYTYDAWGKCTVKNATGSTIGTENPFRYRGYYYDSETELYYLQSRYYDAETGRFINADILISTGQSVLGTNMFAYCGNDPVDRSDESGEFWNVVVGAAVGGVVNALCSAVSGGSTEDIVKAFVVGAVEGAICTVAPILAPITANSRKVAMAAKMTVAAYETVKTVHECRKEGTGLGESMFAGITVFTCSFVYGATGDLLTDTVCDLTLGLAASLNSQMITAEIKKAGRHSKSATIHNVNSGKHYISSAEISRYKTNPYILSTSPR